MAIPKYRDYEDMIHDARADQLRKLNAAWDQLTQSIIQQVGPKRLNNIDVERRLGELIVEYMQENLSNGFDGFSTETISGFSKVLRDVKIYNDAC